MRMMMMNILMMMMIMQMMTMIKCFDNDYDDDEGGKKCWRCACFHQMLTVVFPNLPVDKVVPVG